MNLIRRGSWTFCPEPRGAVYQTSLPQGRSTTFGCSLNGAVPPLLLTYKFLDPIQPAPELLHRCRIRDAHVLRGPERFARHNVNVRSGQESFRKRHGG